MRENKILILGASGLAGRYIFDFFKEADWRPVGTYCSNPVPGLMHFNLTSSSLSELDIKGVKIAILCSAIAKLDKCVENPDLARRTNVICLEKIMLEMQEREIFPVFFSSGAVFDGIDGFYKEDSKRNPLSIYGQQKVEVEDFIFKNLKEFLIIRPGTLFGIHNNEGALFANWFHKYKQNETMLIADDECLSPTYAGDLGRAIDALLNIKARGVYHINYPKPCSRFEMAVEFFKYLNIHDAKIKRCSIDDFSKTQKRAKKTYMDCSKFFSETGFLFTPLERCFDMVVRYT